MDGKIHQELTEGLRLLALMGVAEYCVNKNLTPDPDRLDAALDELTPALIQRVSENRQRVLAGEITGDHKNGEDLGLHIFKNIVISFARNAVDRAITPTADGSK